MSAVSPPAGHNRLRLILPWLIALALVAWVLMRVPLTQTRASLSRLTPGGLLVLTGFNALVLLTLPARWWLIWRGLGHRLPFVSLLGARLAAFGLSYFTPGPQFGGEPLQVLLPERRHGVPRPTAVAAVVLDRSLELLVNFSFLLVGAAILAQGSLGSAWRLLDALPLLAGLFLLPASYLGAIWAGWRPLSRLLNLARRLFRGSRAATSLARWERLQAGLWAAETEAAALCRRRPAALAAALGASVLHWSLLMAEFWVMFHILGLRLDLWTGIVVLLAARLAILLPVPGGLGTLEAGLVVALEALGLDPALGLSAALIIRARDVLLAGFGLWWGTRAWRRPAAVGRSEDGHPGL